MKKTILTFLTFLFGLSITGFGQIQFLQEYGGAFKEDGRWMEQTADSGFIMTGSTTTFSNGQTDIWLVRADAYGTQMWTQSIGGTGFDFGNMVKITSDGGFIIAGFTNTYGGGGNDGWLIKTDPAGNIQWTRTVGDTGLQELEAVVQTSDGGYAAIGVNKTAGTQHYDILLVKTNSAGVIQWERNIGGQSYEIGNALQETSDGGFILAGQTYSYGNLDGDYYLVKTNSTGIVQWQKTYSYAGLQESHYVQITPDSGFIMVGDADSIPNGLGETDILMIRTNSIGDTIWTHTYGGSKKDGGKTVENTTDGGFVIAGITRSFGLTDPNYFLVKTDSLGVTEWNLHHYGSDHHDHAYRGLQTSDGGYAEVGFFRNAAGYENFALVKLGLNGGVTKDLAIDNINYPDTIICQATNVPVTLAITNYGATNEANIIVNLHISDASNTNILSVQDTITTTMLPTTTYLHTFSQNYNFHPAGSYLVKAYIVHRQSDISYTNDSVVATFTVVSPTGDPVTTSAVNCNAASMTLMATPASAVTDSMFWYDAPVNGNMISTGSSYLTPLLSSSTTYYVQSVKGKGNKVGLADNSVGGGTASNNGILYFDVRRDFTLISVKVYATSSGIRIIELRDDAGVVIQSKTVDLPVGESRVYLNFFIPIGQDYELALNTSAGTLFRSTNAAVFPYSISRTVEIWGTSSGSASTWYYFYDWYIFVPHEFCGSNMVPAQAVIGTSTTALDRSRCGPGSITLSANSTAALSWYDSPTGGVLLANGNSFSTPSLSSTTTYYLQVGTCVSRIAVQAIINSQSADPVASDVTNCGPGHITLTATSSDPVNWYDAASNGALVGSGNSFTTPFLNSSETYYAIAGTVCPSNAIAVNAIISSVPPPSTNDVTACGPASVTLTATSVDPVAWYTSSTGGIPITTAPTYTTPVLSSPVTYYVQAMGPCPSAIIPVTANVNETAMPVGTGASRCGTGSVVISAQSVDTVTWWSAPTAGTLLGSGAIYTTPVISTTTIYYAQASNNGCLSSRTAVSATITSTTQPVGTSVANCGPGAITISAASPDTIFWYNTLTGGTLLATGPTFTTPVISTTTTYYAQASSICPSVRTAVDAIITSLSADPLVTNGDTCGTGSVQLSATSTDPVSWYDAPGGTLLGTGLIFNTPVISATTTFYAVAGIAAGCYSNPVAAIATINPLPASPVPAGAQHCGPAQLTLSASASNPISWFTSGTGGTAINTGTTYTAMFNTTTTLYVESNDGTCSSLRIPVIASIYTVPVLTMPSVVNVNSGQTIILNAGAGFSSYLWNTGATTQTITTGVAGTYFVTVTNTNGCQGSDTTVVNVIIGINDLDNDGQVQVYPNPASGKMNVKFNGISAFTLQLMDITGKIVLADKQLHISQNTITYDISKLSEGIYHLKIITDQGQTTRPLIIN
jgi:hypothetical protein